MIVKYGNKLMRYGIVYFKNGKVVRTGCPERMRSQLKVVRKFYGTTRSWVMTVHPDWFEE